MVSFEIDFQSLLCSLQQLKSRIKAVLKYPPSILLPFFLSSMSISHITSKVNVQAWFSAWAQWGRNLQNAPTAPASQWTKFPK